MMVGVRGNCDGQIACVCVPLFPPTDLDWTATLRKLALPGVKRREGEGRGCGGKDGGGGKYREEEDEGEVKWK